MMLRHSKLTVLLVLATLGAAGCFNKTGPKAGGQGMSWENPQQLADFLAAYNSSRFGYCDAQILSEFWESSVRDAKARVGMKLKAGVQDYEIEKWELGPARDRALARGQSSCDVYAEGYSYEDLKLVAQMMGTSDMDAKVFLGEKLFWGGKEMADMWVQDAHGYAGEGYEGEGEGGWDDEVMMADKFWGHGYTWCDATLLAQAWGIDTWEAKVSIGVKLDNGYSVDEIERNLFGGIRQEALASGRGCSFSDGTYKLADAERLACLWGTSVSDVKARVGEKLTRGNGRIIDEEIQRARDTCPG